MERAPLDPLWRVLVIAGLGLASLGLVLWALSRLGPGGLPGDLVIRRGNLTVYLPLATSLLLSVLLTVLLNLLLRR